MTRPTSIAAKLWILFVANILLSLIFATVELDDQLALLAYFRHYCLEYRVYAAVAIFVVLVALRCPVLWRERRILRLVLLPIRMLILLFLTEFSLLMVEQAVMLPKVEQRVGGILIGPVILDGEHWHEVLSLDSIKTGGALADAGAKSGDIVIEPMSINALMRRLALPSGSLVKIQVAEGGDGPSLEARPRRELKIELP